MLKVSATVITETASAMAVGETDSGTVRNAVVKGDARAFWATLSLVSLVTLCLLWIAWPLWTAAIPANSNNRLTTIALVLTPIITLGGIVVAIAQWHRTHRYNIARSRKQHTINILFETRLSSEIRELNESREAYYPAFTDVFYKDWKRLRDETARAGPNAWQLREKNRSLTSLLELLNYYEFVAIGVRLEDLDEEMLHGTLRSIMCNLVDDCRYLIAGLRVRSPTAFDNLCWLYERWRDPARQDVDGGKNERAIPIEPGNDDEWPDPPGG